jgi:hypothetical protein
LATHVGVLTFFVLSFIDNVKTRHLLFPAKTVKFIVAAEPFTDTAVDVDPYTGEVAVTVFVSEMFPVCVTLPTWFNAPFKEISVLNVCVFDHKLAEDTTREGCANSCH